MRRHPWFASVDWLAMSQKRIPPPHKPDLQNIRSNFSVKHELEDQLNIYDKRVAQLSQEQQKWFEGEKRHRERQSAWRIGRERKMA